MYRAKESGRGRYQIFDPEMHQRATERLTIANELRAAIAVASSSCCTSPR